MKLDEFKERLGAEPRSQDPEFLAAKNSSIEYAGLARDALDFEDQLAAALKLPVENDYAERVLAAVSPAPSAASSGAVTRPWAGWMSIAAGILVIFTLGIFIGKNIEAAPLQVAFAEHLQHETFSLGLDKQIPPAKVVAAFAEHGAQWQPVSGSRVTYMSKCEMGDKVGIHVVVVDAQGGRTTMLYLPDQADIKSALFTAGDLPARMMRTADGGAAAVFAHDGQELETASYIL